MHTENRGYSGESWEKPSCRSFQGLRPESMEELRAFRWPLPQGSALGSRTDGLPSSWGQWSRKSPSWQKQRVARRREFEVVVFVPLILVLCHWNTVAEQQGAELPARGCGYERSLKGRTAGHYLAVRRIHWRTCTARSKEHTLTVLLR